MIDSNISDMMRAGLVEKGYYYCIDTDDTDDCEENEEGGTKKPSLNQKQQHQQHQQQNQKKYKKQSPKPKTDTEYYMTDWEAANSMGGRLLVNAIRQLMLTGIKNCCAYPRSLSGDI